MQQRRNAKPFLKHSSNGEITDAQNRERVIRQCDRVAAGPNELLAHRESIFPRQAFLVDPCSQMITRFPAEILSSKLSSGVAATFF